MTENPTPIQQNATQIPIGVIVVSAGAGTGKTSVLSETVASKMIAGERVDVRELIILTFTVKAAAEMAERIERRLIELAENSDDKSERQWLLKNAGNVSDAHIETIDAFSQHILRDNPNETGIDPSFDVLEPNRERELAGVVAAGCFKRWINDPPHENWARVSKGFQFQDWTDIFFRLVNHVNTRQSMTLSGLLKGKGQWDENLISIIEELKKLADQHVKASTDALLSHIDNLGNFLPLAVEQGEKTNAAYVNKAIDVGNDLPDLKKWLNSNPLDWSDSIVGKISSWKLFGTKKGDAGAANDLVKELKSHVTGKAGTETPKHELLKYIDLDRKLLDEKIALAHALVDFHTAFRAERFNRMTLSFSDCALEALNLLKNNPDIRVRYNENFKYVVVDEFQDVNPLQSELIFALCNGDGDDVGNLYVVGDERQSIYGFREADYRLLRDLREKFDGIDEVGKGSRILHENFRSRPQLLDFTNHIFRNVWASGESVRHTDLTPPVENPNFRAGDGGPCIELNLVISDNADNGRKAEAAVMASRLNDLVGNGELTIKDKDKSGTEITRAVTWDDCAVLMRRKKSFDHWEDSFTRLSIPYRTESGGGFWDTQEIADSLALMQCLSNASENLDWAVLLRSPWVGISDDSLFEIADASVNKEWESAVKNLNLKSVSDDARITHFRKWFYDVRKSAGRIPIGTLFTDACRASGFHEKLSSLEKSGQIRANLEKLGGILNSEIDLFDPGAAVEYMRWLRSINTTDAQAVVSSDSSAGAVTLTTVHNAKGREWPVVIVADLNSKPGGGQAQQLVWDENLGISFRWLNPSTGSTETPSRFLQSDEIEKSREKSENERVLYVALTRPRDYLILSSGIKISTPKSGIKFEIVSGSWLRQLDDVFSKSGSSLTGHPDDVENADRQVVIKTRSIVGDTEEEKEIVIPAKYHLVPPSLNPSGKEKTVITSADLFNRLSELPVLPSGSSERYIVTATEILKFEKCPRMYAYRSVWDIPTISKSDIHNIDDEETERKDENSELPASEWGTILHEILEKITFDSDRIEIERVCHQTFVEKNIDNENLKLDAVQMVEKTLSLPIFQKIIACEKSGTIKREFRLMGRVDETSQAVLGTIDLYAHCENKLTIIDYKSGRVDPDNAEKHAERYKTQLALYSMLAAARSSLPLDSVEAHILFLQPSKDIPLDISNADFEKVTDTLKKLKEMSRLNNFAPTPSEKNCRWCDYKDICPSAIKPDTI